MTPGTRVALTAPTVARGDRVREYPAGERFEYRGTVDVEHPDERVETLAVVQTLDFVRARLLFPPGVLASG